MALLFFPASAPHLNLLERLWKFVKKQQFPLSLQAQ